MEALDSDVDHELMGGVNFDASETLEQDFAYLSVTQIEEDQERTDYLEFDGLSLPGDKGYCNPHYC